MFTDQSLAERTAGWLHLFLKAGTMLGKRHSADEISALRDQARQKLSYLNA
jgi:hypothetical protein